MRSEHQQLGFRFREVKCSLVGLLSLASVSVVTQRRKNSPRRYKKRTQLVLGGGLAKKGTGREAGSE